MAGRANRSTTGSYASRRRASRRRAPAAQRERLGGGGGAAQLSEQIQGRHVPRPALRIAARDDAAPGVAARADRGLADPDLAPEPVVLGEGTDAVDLDRHAKA